MQFTKIGAQEPTAEQQEAFERLKGIVDRALSDGRMSRPERDQIMKAIYADHQVTSEECALLRNIEEQISQGLIQIEN